MATTADLITRALRLAQVVGDGQAAPASQMADALDTLNDLIESWNLDSLMVYQTANEQVTLVPGQATYTVGAGGNFNIDRPVKLTAAYVNYQGASFPVEETTQDEYNKITLKGMGQILPRFYLYLNSAPLGSLTLWPTPTEAIPLVLTADTVLPPLSLGTVLSLAPGYSKALRFNLALDLCPEYGREPPPTLAKMAREAKADIKRANYVPAIASFDPALTGSPGGLAGFLSGY